MYIYIFLYRDEEERKGNASHGKRSFPRLGPTKQSRCEERGWGIHGERGRGTQERASAGGLDPGQSLLNGEEGGKEKERRGGRGDGGGAAIPVFSPPPPTRASTGWWACDTIFSFVVHWVGFGVPAS